MKTMKYLIAVAGMAMALVGHLPDADAQTRLWGTYYGGTKGEQTNKVANDAFGNVYVVGNTMSATGIATANSFDSVKLDANTVSGFLAKFDTNGKRVWGTYYGDHIASAADLVDVALDGGGNSIYVLGHVVCPSQGLATPGAYKSQCQGTRDMYLAKFDFMGKRVWGTYFGGPGNESATGLSVMPNGDVYIIGATGSSQGIASAGSVDSTLGGSSDAVVAKFTGSGKLSWARYFGGEGNDFGWDLVCKGLPRTSCFITGYTESSNGIATPAAHDIELGSLGPTGDAFVARISGLSGNTDWSTYYGGTGEDQGMSIAADANLNVYVGGFTYSQQEIATPNGFDGKWNGDWDMFVAKFNGGGQRIVGTYYGNSEQDYLLDLATDVSGNVYMLGKVFDGFSNPDLATPNAYDTTINWEDAIVVKFNPNLGRIWATYYGGNEGEMFDNGGLSVGSNNHVYVTGGTQSPDSMATPGSHKQALQIQDAFLVEFAQ
ncbi:MAG TPA: SBBP repeat-containing protein [Luteimonas sp.]|nr:SBBP repeat-containing protein [Luteimonas sp.]